MRIGVCIPTYKNHLPFLERCLDSIQDQTVQPSIVSISASSITEPLLLKSRPFPVKLLTTSTQQFAATNRNKAGEQILEEVDILSFIDSDDEMMSNRLEYVLRAFEETKADFVLHSFVDLKAPYQTRPVNHNPYSCLINPFTANMLPYAGLEIPSSLPGLHNGHLSVTSKTFKQQSYDVHLPILPGYSYNWEDTEYNRRLFVSGFIGAYIPCRLSLYHAYR